MAGNPLVSIVTPLYNQERFIEETIESVLSQTYQPIEYIVVNDGSTDGSRAVLEPYRDRLTIIDQDNTGQAMALNNGWSLSSGVIIGYLSSDDILEPDCVQRLMDVLTADNSVVCAFPNCDLISAESGLLKHGVGQPFDLEELVIEQNCFIGPGALWRAAAHQEVGGWKPQLKLAPDREYWMRLARHGEFHYVTDSLAGYRLHPQSISYKITSEHASLEYITVLDDYFSSSSVPSAIRERHDEAYANAYWLIARNMVRNGNMLAALKYLRLAVSRYPRSLNRKNVLIFARSSVGKPARLLLGKLKMMRNQ